MIRVGAIVTTFTILTNAGQADVVMETLAMLAGAHHRAE